METLKNNVQGLIFVVQDVSYMKMPLSDPAIYDFRFTILAIDYGAQLIVDQLGGSIKESAHSETGCHT